MTRRVFVAGRGAVSGFGDGVPALLDGVFAGRSALRRLDRLAGVECLTEVAGEVPGADSPPTELPFRFARAAAREALAGTTAAIPLVLATTKADLSGVVGPGEGLGNPHRLAERLRQEFGAPSATAVSCACASGLAALALASRRIRAGLWERALVVGADALHPFIVRGFSALLALDPVACRPFDARRNGLSLGEGAGALLLTAEPTGFEIAGWGEANDANHITGPSREGTGLALAVRRALGDGEIGYVHLHGTGTPYNDAMECRALVSVFGGRTPPCSGTKAQTGHTLGAAGLLETIVTLAALERGEAPRNVGLDEPDSPAEFALVRAPAPIAGNQALKVSAGFGGINAALRVKRCG